MGQWPFSSLERLERGSWNDSDARNSHVEPEMRIEAQHYRTVVKATEGLLVFSHVEEGKPLVEEKLTLAL